MRKVLIIGAGKSSSYLIKYLVEQSSSEHLHIIIADIKPQNIQKAFSGHQNVQIISLDIFDRHKRANAIENSDIVVSMLPARHHIEVAKDCLHFNKNLVTASYVSKEIQNLSNAVKNKGLIFLNEIGVDPGLDHMSAMSLIDKIRTSGGKNYTV